MKIETFIAAETFIKYGVMIFDEEFLFNSGKVKVLTLYPDDMDTTLTYFGKMFLRVVDYIIDYDIPDDIKESDKREMYNIKEQITTAPITDTYTLKLLVQSFFAKFTYLVEDMLREIRDDIILAYVRDNGEKLSEKDIYECIYLSAYEGFKEYGKEVVPDENYDLYAWVSSGPKIPVIEELFISLENYNNLTRNIDKMAIGKFIAQNANCMDIQKILKIQNMDPGVPDDKPFEPKSSIAIKPTPLTYFMSNLNNDYNTMEKLHGNAEVHDVKDFNISEYNGMRPPKILTEKETNKAITYNIQTEALDEFEDVAIHLRRLFKTDYPESIHQLETYLYTKTLDELKEMLDKLS